MFHTKYHNPFRKNTKFYLGIIMTIIEGLLSSVVSFTILILVKILLESELNVEKIKQITLFLIIIFAIRFVLYGVGYTLGQIGGAQVSKSLRLQLGDKCKSVPLGRFQEGQVGSYINVLTANVASYEQVLTHKTGNLVKNGSILFMLIVYSLYLYPCAGILLCMISFTFVPELLLSFCIVNRYGSKRNDIYNEAVSNVVEYITGIQTLRAYGMTGKKNEALTKSLSEFGDISYLYEAKGIPLAFGFNILQWLSLPIVMLAGSKPWIHGELSSASFLMLSMIPILLSKLLMAISIDCFSVKNMMLAKKNIVDVFEEPEEVVCEEEFRPNDNQITFQNVSFSYDGKRTVLRDCDFVIPEGKLTAIVGDSGSGKSTIMNLIGKYYSPTAGTIVLGGLDLSKYPSEKVLSNISFVDQDVFLFNDTVKENIRYAKMNATDEEIKVACQKANCEEFVLKMSNGYDTIVGENGSFLSGGERQRLSIARAILKDSPIVLLDEATASLDIENELLVRQAIVNLLDSNKTVVVIAHTLPIVKEADSIIVINNETIAEMGTHNELLGNKGKYYQMWNAGQASC